jgi:hypothetical protein
MPSPMSARWRECGMAHATGLNGQTDGAVQTPCSWTVSSLGVDENRSRTVDAVDTCERSE